jgi:hypothetical protein
MDECRFQMPKPVWSAWGRTSGSSSEGGSRSRKAAATLRFVWNWAYRRGQVPAKFPEVELVFPKEKQPEPFRTYDQIQAILARGRIDKRRERELWDGLFLDPTQVAEVLEHVCRKPNTKYLHPFLVTAA